MLISSTFKHFLPNFSWNKLTNYLLISSLSLYIYFEKALFVTSMSKSEKKKVKKKRDIPSAHGSQLMHALKMKPESQIPPPLPPPPPIIISKSLLKSLSNLFPHFARCSILYMLISLCFHPVRRPTKGGF